MMDTTKNNLTLYQQHHLVFDTLKNRFPNIFALSQIVWTPGQMDDAVGASRNCTLHWIKGENPPSGATERRAGVYLHEKAQGPRPVQSPAATVPNPEASMFLISVPEGSKAKATMLLSMLRNINCEVVDF